MLIENLTEEASGVQKSFISSSRLRCNEVLYYIPPSITLPAPQLSR